MINECYNYNRVEEGIRRQKTFWLHEINQQVVKDYVVVNLCFVERLFLGLLIDPLYTFNYIFSAWDGLGICQLTCFTTLWVRSWYSYCTSEKATLVYFKSLYQDEWHTIYKKKKWSKKSPNGILYGTFNQYQKSNYQFYKF